MINFRAASTLTANNSSKWRFLSGLLLFVVYGIDKMSGYLVFSQPVN